MTRNPPSSTAAQSVRSMNCNSSLLGGSGPGVTLMHDTSTQPKQTITIDQVSNNNSVIKKEE